MHPFDRNALESEIDSALQSCSSSHGALNFESLLDAACHMLQIESPRCAVRANFVLVADGPNISPSILEASRNYTEHVWEPQSAAAPSATQFRNALPRDIGSLKLEELHKLRRRLASQHHPDRAPDNNRKAANEQMSRINQALDAAIEALTRRE